MKIKYEKPVVVPLGEIVKGSGQCNVGSAVTSESTECKFGGNFMPGTCYTVIR